MRTALAGKPASCDTRFQNEQKFDEEFAF